MVHLLVHVVDDVIHLGPPFLHNMMPWRILVTPRGGRY
jgi:hypothetical protein